MSDQGPIETHSTPTPDQVAAGVRQILGYVSTSAATLGMTGLAGAASHAVAYSGLIATVVLFVWGQIVTRSRAKRLVTLTAQVPDSVATFK